MKHEHHARDAGAEGSPPAWGAWIETLPPREWSRWGPVAPRVGGVDWNTEAGCKEFIRVKSPPAWGAWIETRWGSPALPPRHRSPPAWGAWIETHDPRPDHGRPRVAPRVGGVD